MHVVRYTQGVVPDEGSPKAGGQSICNTAPILPYLQQWGWFDTKHQLQQSGTTPHVSTHSFSDITHVTKSHRPSPPVQVLKDRGL